ncbi:hypothetical protein BJV78DRAFT_1158688 [Lactifluus subvellereus]|nr:hypothetical protein BJV78DRAFT_1158688 [Lactifluus subvellereus]
MYVCTFFDKQNSIARLHTSCTWDDSIVKSLSTLVISIPKPAQCKYGKARCGCTICTACTREALPKYAHLTLTYFHQELLLFSVSFFGRPGACTNGIDHSIDASLFAGTGLLHQAGPLMLISLPDYSTTMIERRSFGSFLGHVDPSSRGNIPQSVMGGIVVAADDRDEIRWGRRRD